MTKEAPPTFADELKALEKVLKELESGKLDLVDALARFESGVQLTRKLRTRLDAAEQRIEELLADGSTRDLHVD